MNLIEAWGLLNIVRQAGYTVDSLGLLDTEHDEWGIRVRLPQEDSRLLQSAEDFGMLHVAMDCSHHAITLKTASTDLREAVAVCADCGQTFGADDPEQSRDERDRLKQMRWYLAGELARYRSQIRTTQLPRSMR